ncbi:hypothetical protein QR680_016224 [Steinernema hermaphroditum]|uniref:YitH/HolE acetyltransferase (GNAT) domain-containing protein n=1 Tax=Steinernema hermaphroditum TaxID=289476 RepID=A0AA39LLZ6_9BILA|nr:hypothetical protein QR680_016224 [Steinernema hermaphroditum]
MLPDSYELVVNPPQKMWEEIVTQIHDELSWKMSFHDYQCYLDGYGTENFKFLVAIDKATGKPASCICGALFPKQNGSPQLYTIGMYYTHPELRASGLGLGRILFDELTKIANGTNRFLNAAPVMAKKYAERSGFDQFSPWSLVAIVAQAKDCDISKIDVFPDVSVVDLNGVELEELDEYDRSVGGGISRIEFLQRWLTQDDSFNKFAINEVGNVVGYCNARIVCGNHVVLGPFYADSADIASSLMRHTLESVPDFLSRNQLVAYISSENKAGMEMFKKMVNGEVNTDRLMPRQFDKQIIDSSGDKVYAITETDTSFI